MNKVTRELAGLMSALYREDIDSTGQPMSPDPFSSIQDAIAHYRVDDVLISTLSGEQSRWLESDLVGRVREITDKPVAHHEAGNPVGVGAAAGETGGSGSAPASGEDAPAELSGTGDAADESLGGDSHDQETATQPEDTAKDEA